MNKNRNNWKEKEKWDGMKDGKKKKEKTCNYRLQYINSLPLPHQMISQWHRNTHRTSPDDTVPWDTLNPLKTTITRSATYYHKYI
jgi:hypothetical protein